MLWDPTSGVPLEDLLETIGVGLTQIVVSAATPAVRVRAVVIHDRHEPLPATPGGLLLAVGMTPSEILDESTIRAASDRGFVGIVVKRHGQELDALAERATGSGLALAAAADAVSWRQLDALLSSILAAATTRPGGDTRVRGNGLFQIADTVAAVFGGSVAIENLARQVLAYSSVPGQRIDPLRQQGILDRRVPPQPDDAALYRRVLEAEGVVRFPQRGAELPRAAARIAAGATVLGTLWAIEGARGCSPRAERALLDGASLAALHLLRTRSADDVESARRSELLRALLEGSAWPKAAWSHLGLAPEARVVLVAFAPDLSPGSQPTPSAVQIVVEARRVCALLRPGTPVADSAHAAYALLSARDPSAAGTWLAERVLENVSRTLHHRARAAISSAGSGPTSIPALRAEVGQILRASAASGPGAAPRIASVADVRSSILLMHFADTLATRPELRHPGLLALDEHDRRHRTELAPSLLAWLDSRQNVTDAARELHLHPNTLRHRLRRAQQLAGLDLDDPDELLAVWLQLRLLVAGAVTAPGAGA